MRKILKPIMLSAVFMLSLTSCGGKSAASMFEALKKNEFEVEQITTENNQDELNALELLINAGLLAAGSITDIKEGVDILSLTYAVKVDDSGTHSAGIYELGSADEANLIYKFVEENGNLEGDESQKFSNFVVTGSCYVGYSDDYTKGVLGL